MLNKYLNLNIWFTHRQIVLIEIKFISEFFGMYHEVQFIKKAVSRIAEFFNEFNYVINPPFS